MAQNGDKKKLDWKPALEIFSRVSTWVVAPIVLALIIGKALDSKFGTRPWIFLLFTGIAFITSSFGIVRVVGKFMKDIDSPSQKAEEDKKRN